jgi:alkylated DNA repair protein alkB family protein 6
MSRDPELAKKLSGEWLINASIMQCDNAVFGRLVFTEGGELVYLAATSDLIGRGVGKWVSEGSVVGFQVDIYQYAPTTQKHVHGEPHRFRALSMASSEQASWSGEWFFCAFQQPPRSVGRFVCYRRNAGGPPPSPKKSQDLPDVQKKAVIALLDKLTEPPPMTLPRWVPHHQPGDIQDVHYVRSFLDPKQVEEFMRIIDKSCEWEPMSTRDTQEFGSSQRCPCGRSLQKAALPQWQATMINAISNLGVFHPVLYPANSVRLNAYKPGQGIHPHCDGPVYFPRAAIVTLGSHCVFDFYPRVDPDDDKRGAFQWDRDKEVPAAPELPPDCKPKLSLILEPGSLLVFSGDAFINHRHGIAPVEQDEIGPHIRNAKDIGLSNGDTLRRGRRVSLTIRHLLPRCQCSSVV